MTEPNESATLLKAFFTRLRNLDEEAQAITADKREVLKEAKGVGFDGPTLTKMVQRARKDPKVVLEADGLLETYEAITCTGAAAGGALQMTRNAETGMFEARIGPSPDAEEKLSKATRARRDAVALAELARAARGDE